MNKKLLLGLVISFIFAFSNAYALTVEQYLKLKNNPQMSELNSTYLQGVVSGFLFANTDLILNKKNPLYCQPQELALGVEQIQSILDIKIAVLDEKMKINDYPVELILLHGLMSIFPCNK